jgi:alkylated DNA nucleotide flippase Atl1
MESFRDRVIELALGIPEGRVTTYGDLARAAGGGPQAARSITTILASYPNHAAIPFHRIVYADGKVWMPSSYATKRRALYKREGIIVNHDGVILNFDEVRYDFRDFT